MFRVKKNILINCLLLLSLTAALGANPRIDSLNRELQKRAIDDSSKSLIHYQLISEYLNYENNVNLAEYQLSILLTIKDSQKKEFIPAVQSLSKSLILTSQGNPAQSNFYLYECLHFFEKHKNIDLLKQVYRDLAINYRRIGDVGKSIFFYKKALSLTASPEYSKIDALILINLGLAFFHQKQVDSALVYNRKAFVIYSNFKSDLGKAYVFANNGSVFLQMGKLDSAYSNLNKAQITFKKIGIPSLILQNALEIANFYVATHHIELAEKTIAFIKQETKKQKDYQLDLRVLQTQLNIAKIKKQYVKATELSEMITVLNNKISAQSLEERDKSASYGYVYEKQKYLTQLKATELEIQKRNTLLFAIGLGVISCAVLLLLFAYASIRRQKKQIELQNRIIQEKSETLQLLNTDLEKNVLDRTNDLTKANTELLLKSKEIQSAQLTGQMFERKRIASDLHDNLGGFLAALRWSFIALENSNFSKKELSIYYKIKGMIQEAYAQVRNMSHNLLPEEIEKYGLELSVQKLVNNLNNNEQKVFIYQYEVKIQLSQTLMFELYCIILELITNILKHSKASRIEIKIFEAANNLMVDILENGDPYDFNNSNGKGQENIQERLDRIGGTKTETSYLLSDHSNLNHIKFKCPAA